MSQRSIRRWFRASAVVAVLVVGTCGSAGISAARSTGTSAPRATAPATSAPKSVSDVAVAPVSTAKSAAPATVAAAPVSTAKSAAPATDAAAPALATTSEPVRTLRRLRGSEVNPALVAKAAEIVHLHHHEAFGTEIPFSIDGRDYVGRIERHYHPEGGPARPWGYHPGCSLFAVESSR
jgi:hypothetical protein